MPAFARMRTAPIVAEHRSSRGALPGGAAAPGARSDAAQAGASGSSAMASAAINLVVATPCFCGQISVLYAASLFKLQTLLRADSDVNLKLIFKDGDALITLKEMPHDAWREARIGIAGPLLGSAGAAVIYLAGIAYDSQHLKALAFLGFFINLFNLLPVVPLDGGRAMAAMSPWMWFVGFFGIVVLAFVFPNPIIIALPSTVRFTCSRGPNVSDGIATSGTLEIPLADEGRTSRDETTPSHPCGKTRGDRCPRSQSRLRNWGPECTMPKRRGDP